MDLTFHLPDEISTSALGKKLAALLKAGDVIALHGDLGAGKTTLVRALVRAICGEDEEVPSPTYTLVQVYDGPDFPLWHFDLYRLEEADGVTELGWDETMDGASLIEWPERAGRHLPRERLDVFLEMSGDGRRVRLEPEGEGWQERLHDFRL